MTMHADPAPAHRGGDAHAFDLAALHAVARKARDHGQLQAADHGAAPVGHQQHIAGLRGDVAKRLPIGGRQWIARLLAVLAERVVGE